MKQKIALIFLFSWLVIIQLYSQFSDEIIIKTCTTCGASKVLSADLDGDMDLDVISLSKDDNKIAWYENDGSGTFSGQKLIAKPINKVTTITTTDLDKDNDVDIIVFYNSERSIVLFENNGNGDFAENKIVINQTKPLTSLFAIDIDGDEDIDIAAFSLLGDKIIWFQNDGDGNFSEEIVIPHTGNNVDDLRIVDIDADGDFDLIASFLNSSKITLHENDGIGNFEEYTLFDDETLARDMLSIGDLDGDGDIDILRIFEEEIVWYENEGLRKFSREKDFTNNSVFAHDISAVAIEDLDNDGKVDVLVTFENQNEVVWYKNEGKLGRDLNLTQVNISRKTYQPLDIQTADLDGDGDTDILSASYEDDKIAWFENIGIQDSFPETIITSSAAGAVDITGGDLDGDGDIDLVAGSEKDTKLVYYLNDGMGIFSSPTVITNDLRHIGALHDTQDFDNDGDLDIFANAPHGAIWYVNEGRGKFSIGNRILPEDPDFSLNFSRFFTGEINQDGRIDVLVSKFFSPQRLFWLANEGQGNYVTTENVINTIEDFVIAFKLSDLDGDGTNDISLGYQDNNLLIWQPNDGAGNFLAGKVIDNNISVPSSIDAADVDADGDNDLLVSAEGDGKLLWYINDGLGNFDEKTTIFTNEVGVSKAYAIDIDKDGDFDVLTFTHRRDKIAWFENDGLGNFSEEKIISTTADGIRDIFVADLDGDGDLDIAAASFFDDKIAWYRNLGGVAVNTEEETSLSRIKVYPNPFKASLVYEFSEFSMSEKPTMTLYDSRGRLLQIDVIQNTPYYLSTTHLEKGLYFYKITRENGLVKSGKLVKH